MPRPIIRVAWLFAVVVLCSTAVFGQTTTVINPKIVQFDPSADNSALTSDGLPVVIRYDLQIYPQGGTVPYTTVNLGKPAVGADGTIQVDFSVLMTSWPLPDGTYDARVVAVGQSGVGQSDLSNQFAFQSTTGGTTPTCTYALSATTWTPTATGGTVDVIVTASNSSCGWAAIDLSTWATVGPASGTGTGSVTVTVAPNTGSTRTAILTIAGQVFTVTQAALSCTYALAAPSLGVAATGGTGGVAVTASLSTCGWAAASDSSWATVSPATGTGSGSVTVTVAPNTGSTRTAVLTIAGQAYTVTQAAALSCGFTLAPSSLAAPVGGIAATAMLTAGSASCAWSASSDASWATVSPSSGTGSGSVTVTVAANAGAARTATLSIAGQVYLVSQAGLSCSFALSPSTLSVAATGGAGTTVLASSATACGWTAASGASWIGVSPQSGSGTSAVTVSVAANSGAARTGTVAIGGQTFTVTEAGLSCTYALSPSSLSALAIGATSTVNVSAASASCGWTAVSNATWVTVSPSSGIGSGAVTVKVAANTGAARTATVTIAGLTFAVSQAAASCTYGVSPTAVKVTSAGVISNFSVTASASTCTWAAKVSVDWIAVSPVTGSGSKSVSYTVAKNSTTTKRIGTVTVGGSVLTVTQDSGTRPSQVQGVKVAPGKK